MQSIIQELEGKEKIFTDSLQSMEIERLISKKDIAEFTKSLKDMINVSVIMFKVGDRIDSESMDNYETMILDYMSKIDELSASYKEGSRNGTNLLNKK